MIPGDQRQDLRILVTAEARAGAKLARALRTRGFVPVALPCISVIGPRDESRLAGRLSRLDDVDWIVVTSRNGADTLARLCAPVRLDSTSIAAVGSSTAARLEGHGFAVDLVPERARAAALLESLRARDLRGAVVLLLLGDLADDRLDAGLRDAGAVPERFEAYRTLEEVADPGTARRLLSGAAGRVIVTLMSGSAARSLHAAIGATLFEAQRFVCIGPSTAAELRRLGAAPDAVATPHTVDGLVEAVSEIIAG